MENNKYYKVLDTDTTRDIGSDLIGNEYSFIKVDKKGFIVLYCGIENGELLFAEDEVEEI